MAQPIEWGTTPRNPRLELYERLEQAPAEHAEALLDSYELLQALHDSGALKLLRGALGSADSILGIAVEGARSDEAIRGLRNAIILAKMLGSVNPDLLQGIANAVSETLGCRKPIVEPPGLFPLLAEFRHPELRRSMALINRFLEVLGNELRTRGECH